MSLRMLRSSVFRFKVRLFVPLLGRAPQSRSTVRSLVRIHSSFVPKFVQLFPKFWLFVRSKVRSKVRSFVRFKVRSVVRSYFARSSTARSADQKNTPTAIHPQHARGHCMNVCTHTSTPHYIVLGTV